MGSHVHSLSPGRIVKKDLLERLHPSNPGYQRYEAWFMRLGLAILLYFNLPVDINNTGQPTPNGLAHWIDFTWAADPEVMKILKRILIPVLALYVFGVLRWLMLPYMFTLSLAVGTLKNSQGGEIAHVYQALTMVLLVQMIWYLYYEIRFWIGKPHHFQSGWTRRSMEVFATQSALAGIYFTTAVTKLIESKGAWLWQIRKIGVELERTWQQKYYHKLEEQGPAWALWFKDFITANPWAAIVIFGPGLIAELIVPAALYGRRRALIIGILLIILHVGAIYIMRLNFWQNIALLAIFYVNIPYWIISSSQAATRRVRASS